MPRRLAGLFALTVATLATAADDFAYVRAHDPSRTRVVVDTRPLDDCLRQSLPGAVCLPPTEILGPGRRLPNERDLLWLLGTARLTGAEEVLVAGRDATARDFVAGLLYWAGQYRVRVLTEPVDRLLKADVTTPGQARDFARAVVFEAPMRDELVLLRHELAALLQGASPPGLLDGRTAVEYWGGKARAPRGGHLPGALSLPAVELAAPAAAPAADYLAEGDWVAYGHDAYEGLAYLTRLRAGQGVAARLYLGGWAEWAADGSLPADAATYPEPQASAAAASAPVAAAPRSGGLTLAAALLLASAAFATGWWLQRQRSP